MTVSNRVSQKIISHQSIDLHEKKSSTSTVNLNKRLGEFNSKLQFAIGHENNNELHHSKSQEQVSYWEKERKNLVDRYES